MAESRDDPGRGRQVQRGAPLRFTLDGEEFRGFAGETVAAALMAAGRSSIRRSARVGASRGIYCNMGVCYECLVIHRGRAVRACMLPVQDGMALGVWGPQAVS